MRIEGRAYPVQGLASAEINRYNGFNQLIETRADGVTAGYSYYPGGLRATKTAGGVTTSFILDGGNVAIEAVGSTVTAKYVRGMNLINSTIGGVTNWYLYNAHGDVVKLTNSSGTVMKTYNYDAFGVEKNPDPNDANNFRYAGEYFDKETGTYYLRARYYNPSTGRFSAEDPIRSGLNWYTYCVNNPLAFIDPWGLAEVAARAFAEGYGASVQWNYNYSSSDGTVYARATFSYGNFSSLSISGVLRNDIMYADDSVFNNYFGWDILSSADVDAGVLSVNVDGQFYKDVSTPLNTALASTVATAEAKYRSLESPISVALWFNNQVKPYAPWDIKVAKSWEDTIGSTFLGSYNAPVYYQGWLTTPEELGNYTFGYIGAATGFDLLILIGGSWYADGFSTRGTAFDNETRDWGFVSMGYDAYCNR